MSVTTRWSWKRWHARLDRAPLSAAHKEICRQFAEVSRTKGKTRRWVQGWEIGWTGLESEAMWRAEQVGLAYRAPGNACFFAVLERIRRPDSAALSLAQLKLLDQLRDGWSLYRVNHHGYIDQKTAKHRWLKVEGWPCGYKPVPDRIVNSLGQLGLLWRDGCGHGWPFQYTSRFSIARHKLYIVRNLTPSLARLSVESQAERVETESEYRHQLLWAFRCPSETA